MDRAAQLLRDDIVRTFELLGVRSVDELDPSRIRLRHRSAG